MSALALDTILCRSIEVLASEVGKETMMMDAQKGMYYALNTVSSRIWALLEKPLSIKALCEQLLEEYEVDPDRCEQEVKQVLGKMLERNLVTVIRSETVACS